MIASFPIQVHRIQVTSGKIKLRFSTLKSRGREQALAVSCNCGCITLPSCPPGRGWRRSRLVLLSPLSLKGFVCTCTWGERGRWRESPLSGMDPEMAIFSSTLCHQISCFLYHYDEQYFIGPCLPYVLCMFATYRPSFATLWHKKSEVLSLQG